jgi:hypothetical protein
MGAVAVRWIKGVEAPVPCVLIPVMLAGART